jgi:hypothetical protein
MISFVYKAAAGYCFCSLLGEFHEQAPLAAALLARMNRDALDED